MTDYYKKLIGLRKKESNSTLYGIATNNNLCQNRNRSRNGWDFPILPRFEFTRYDDPE